MRYRPPSARQQRDWTALSGSSRTADGDATSLLAYLIAGPAVYGGIGYLVDQWLGTRFGVGIGILLGMALSLYVVWLRYGRR